jgi:soluble lytic murein transglycosylase
MITKINFLKIILCSLITFFLVLSLSGCEKIKQSLLDKIKNTEKTKIQETQESVTETQTEITETAENETTSFTNETTMPKDESDSSSTGGTDESTVNTEIPEETTPETDLYGIKDLRTQRNYFIYGVESFEEKKYLIAEYYLNQVKDTYKILTDHILYYLAKSLLMQEKYTLAEENYLKLKINYPDSIFSEKANLEYADLFFLLEDYITAETQYEKFIKNFSQSELLPYSLYQLAVCQEKNSKFINAFENYKRIWLEYPESDYAQDAYDNIENLANKNIIDTFTPTNNEFYNRGEKFFNLYWYESAIQEFIKILDSAATSGLSAELHAKTIFKTGMCYFNLRDYKTSRDYLLSCYEKFPSGSYADDSLYFLGRVETNLDREDSALDYYDRLVKKFPTSNYSDDALYRSGRIYFLRDEIDKASVYYQQIINQYPSGDKAQDAYWELGWIQYKSEDYSASKNTFSGMVSRFKGNQISIAAQFWQAKSHKKLGENEEATNLYKEIVSNKTYSYYTFASKNELENMGISADIGLIDTSVQPDNPEIAEILPEVYKDIENNNINTSSENSKYSHVEKAKELLIIEFYESADKEIETASKEFEEDNMGILQISTLYLKAKDYINSQKIIAKYYSKLTDNLISPYRDYFYYLLYPYGFKEYVVHYSAEFDIDPLFVLAVIREESRFNPEAGSYAGALGLMQIIPNTGKSIAKALGIENFNNDMLYDPETSIKMGTYYLKRQMDNFNANLYFTCGAYNGGPGAMKKWISKWGDKEIDEFIEYIPYDETRNYVKKVMASYFFYQMLFENS